MFASLSLLTTLALAIYTIASPASKPPLARVITSCNQPGTAALTFDDGPYIHSGNITKALVAAGAVATFFVNGNNWCCIYAEESVARIKHAYNQGHMIASHTWAHKDLTTLTLDEINKEMELVDQALQRILGVIPAFMRPPYGNYNNLVRQVARARGQEVVIWDFDSLDSDGATAQESNKYYDELVDRHPPSVLALNHETYKSTAEQVVPHAIAALQAAGYKLVTVAECLGMEPYQSVTEPPVFDPSWIQTCSD